jgi:ribosomal protein S21
MVYVKKNPGESDDAVIRKFTKKVIDAQIVQEARRRQFYLKPSLAKKVKQEESRRMRRRIV